jgi:hypothetical protein
MKKKKNSNYKSFIYIFERIYKFVCCFILKLNKLILYDYFLYFLEKKRSENCVYRKKKKKRKIREIFLYIVFL